MSALNTLGSLTQNPRWQQFNENWRGYCWIKIDTFPYHFFINLAKKTETQQVLSINFLHDTTNTSPVATMETDFLMFGTCIHLQVHSNGRSLPSTSLACHSTFSYVHPFDGEEIIVKDDPLELLSLEKFSSGRFCLKVRTNDCKLFW